MVRRSWVARLAALLVILPSCRLAAQVGGPLQPPTTGGLPVLLQELRMLGHNKRVLLIGAHPDDEDTELMVMLTRREGAETGYLSLTRGEGGQNLIGNELGEALGILRTEELMAARNIDGAQQFFTRAYDFGYSKSLEDTWAHWPKDSVLKDVVRIIRRFRPQVVVTVFRGGPLDGHGQHQAAGWASQEAFRIAGDPTRFPELATEEGLQPFSPTKLYRFARFDPDGGTVKVDGGEVERLSGKTYHQLAMLSRSQHRSQDMGRIQDFGPSIGGVDLLQGPGPDVGTGWAAFWSGVDTVLRAPPEHFAALAEARAAAGRDPIAVGNALSRAAEAVGPNGRTIPFEYTRHLREAQRVVSWLFMDAVVEHPRVAPGDSIGIRLMLRNAGRQPLRVYGIAMVDGLPGVVAMGALPDSVIRGTTMDARILSAVPSGTAPSSPYYLAQPRVGDLYSWGRPERSDRSDAPAAGWMGSAGGIGGLVASVDLGGGFWISTSVSSRVRDQAFGEVRRPVVIVPRIGVKLTPGVAVVRTSATGEARVVTADVALESGLAAPVSGTVTIEVPDGWPRPTPVPFQLAGIGATAHIPIRVTVPAGLAEGEYPLRAVATDQGGQRYDIGAFMVDYPHIRPRQYTRPATARIEVMELTPPLARRIGYVRGAADRVPEALAAAGLSLTLLDSTALSTGDLSSFDAIVIGPRAYEVDSAVVRNNARLLAYARDGGRLIVQYQQQLFLEGDFAPYQLGGNSRITDERSPVTMLPAVRGQPTLPAVFRTPNAIGPNDWTGWVQERALYCPTTWAPEFRPRLAMNDPDEAPIQGCLLEANVGRGSYVYTGISFFRELPAGVPGAYRLFFNLLGGRATP